MKKIAHYEFETPKIIGILSDRNVPSNILEKFDKVIKRKRGAYVCLPFKVEAKYLKNVVQCMRIMDIAGLVVIGDHETRIGKLMRSGRINVLKRTGNLFKGYNFENKETFYKDAVNLLTADTSKKR